MSVGHHHRDLRVQHPNLLQKFLAPGFLGNEDGKALLFGDSPYRRRSELSAPAGRPVRLSHHPYDFVTLLSQGPKGWKGKDRGPPKQNPQDPSSSARLFCHFLMSRRRFRGLTRSMNKIPSK